MRVQGHGAEEVDDGRDLSHVLDGVKGGYWVVGCDDAIVRVGGQKGLSLVGQACDKRPLLVGDFAVQGSLDEMVLVVLLGAGDFGLGVGDVGLDFADLSVVVFDEQVLEVWLRQTRSDDAEDVLVNLVPYARDVAKAAVGACT